MRDYYNDTLDRIILDLERSNPEWASAVRKWRSFLARAAYLISETTGSLPEDALGDILESVTFVFDLYRGDIFKYEGTLYRVREVSEGFATIYAVRRLTREREGDRVVLNGDLEPVKRGKLDTMLYHCVYQQYVNIIRSNFTGRNGFVSVGAEDTVMVSRFGQGRSKLIRKSQKLYERCVHEVEFSSMSPTDALNYRGYTSVNPEECVRVMEFLNVIEHKLSDKDVKVFELLLIDPFYTLNDLTVDTGLSEYNVRRARAQIKKSFNDITESYV